MTVFSSANLEWKENLSANEWDSCLSSLQGHPLQSALWGESKTVCCGIRNYRWVAYQEGCPVFMVRLEERRFMKFFKIAWVPKGPTMLPLENESALYKAFFKKLREKGFFICATNPWKVVQPINKKSDSFFYTIWIDLTLSKEKLWENLHKQCRYDIRRGKKLGVIVEQSKSLDDLNLFANMCNLISKTKGFELGNSAQLMNHLFLTRGNEVESYLFVARHEENVCGGAFIIRSGKSIHYIWGAVDRKFSHLCIGEVLQWEIIEWGLNQNCTKYDLEGISTLEGGVDRFKKKFGGSIVTCPQIQTYPLYGCRSLTSFLIKLYIRLQPKLNKYKNNLINYFKA